MNQIPDVLYADQDFQTWLILGASRGIGLEFVRQLLNRDEHIMATVREPWAGHASGLWGQAGSDHGRCQMYTCDILSEQSIEVSQIFCLRCPLHVEMRWHGATNTGVRNSLPRLR